MRELALRDLINRSPSWDSAVATIASFGVTMGMVAAFAGLADFGFTNRPEQASLTVFSLSGAEAGGESEATDAAVSPPPAEAKPEPQKVQEKQDTPAPEKPAEPILLPPNHPPVSTRSTPLPLQLAHSSPSHVAPAVTETAAEATRLREEMLARAARDKAEAAARADANQRSSANAAGGADGGYKAVVWQHLQRFRRPNTIGPGATFVRFTIDAAGTIAGLGITRGSGSSSFDREALQMVRRATPFPKPPDGTGVTFNFQINGR